MFPQMYARTSTGKIKTWKIEVVENPDKTATINTHFGQLGGKIQKKVVFVKTGKNIGKANETTPYDQALNDARSDYNKKVDKKYITEIPNGDNEPDILLPMLALKFKDRKHNVKYPAYVQPKLNGVRCLATKLSDTEIRFTSRKFKTFPPGVTAHLVKPLLAIMELDEIADGEFYVHDWSFQDITRTVTEARKWAGDLEYHIFDGVNPDVKFKDRYNRVVGLGNRAGALGYNHIKYVTCYLITHESEVKNWHDKFVAEGFEGVMVRNVDGLYKLDHRSKDLQKYKEFIDEEFMIVGLGDKQEVIIDPVTLEKTICVVFKCRLNINDETFDVRPKGTVAHRAELYNRIDELVGMPLTVRYQELSEDKKPIFPVGLAVRDYE